MNKFDFYPHACEELGGSEYFFLIKDESYDSIIWRDGEGNIVTPPFTEQDIDALSQTKYDEYLSAEYQRTRADAYPSIQEQLDMQYWDSVNGTTTWADAIQAVKDAYPKP